MAHPLAGAITHNTHTHAHTHTRTHTHTHTPQEEAREAFRELLAAAGVGGASTWDGALRSIINDARYGALKSLGERKQAFNEYVQVRL